MKKFFRSAAILVFGLGMATTFTACHNGESEPSTAPQEMTEANGGLELDAARLVVYTNVAANVKYGDVQKKATAADGQFKAEFDATNATEVSVSLDGYLTQTIDNVKFGQDEQVKVMTFSLAKVAVNQLSQAQVASDKANGQSSSVTNDGDNQTDPDVVVTDESGNDQAIQATIEVPATVTATDNATGETPTEPYSIVVYTPATSGNEEDVEANESVEEAVLGIACTPHNTTFSEPVNVTVNIPGSDGLNLALVNKTSKDELTFAKEELTRSGDKITAKIPHFSSWEYFLRGQITSVVDGEETLVQPTTLSVSAAGQRSIRYNRYIGFESEYAPKSLLGKFLAGFFGVNKTQLGSTFKVNATGAGTISYRVVQAVKTVTFNAGRTFTVKVYGKVTPTATFTPAAEPVVVHNGGSN